VLRIIFGVFVMFHGLVHLLYFGQSRRLFELRPGMVWPDAAWAFSRLLGNENTRALAGTILVLAALGFLAAGTGVLFMRSWWRPLLVSAAALSAVSWVLFWDGALQDLPSKGAIGILISAAILVLVLIFQWPNLGTVDR
jgi:hypothetical protein